MKRALLLISALATGLCLTVGSYAPASAAGAPARAAHARTPLLVRGITLSGLQDWLPANAAFSPRVALPADRIGKMEAQIYAARHNWNANVVRFQVVQDKLVGTSGRGYSPVYMSQIRAVTDYALHQGLTVVLNAQTEVSTGFMRNESLPTQATASFWRHIMTYYASNPHVIFDLFNEPRNCSWRQWRRAMQGLVNMVRRSGAHNTLWVEGRWWGSTLDGVPLLRGGGIVYSFHHPGSPWPGQGKLGVGLWNRAFGNLAKRGIPVVDGEFVNYKGGYHWRDPQVTVPKFLRYLVSHHIGITAYTLLPGLMNSGSNLGSVTNEPNGDGSLIMRLFHHQRF